MSGLRERLQRLKRSEAGGAAQTEARSQPEVIADAGGESAEVGCGGDEEDQKHGGTDRVCGGDEEVRAHGGTDRGYGGADEGRTHGGTDCGCGGAEEGRTHGGTGRGYGSGRTDRGGHGGVGTDDRQEAKRTDCYPDLEREAEQERVRSEWSCIGGMRLVRNASGSFLLRESVYAGGYRHGDLALHELSTLAGELGALIGGASGEHGDDALPEAEKLLFFDTETTGLGVGAGNVPFMIGAGFFRGDEFVVQQLFIRNMAEEAAMLAYLRELLQRFTHIVSYNGRTFDWPIVKSRYVLSRRRLEEDGWLHLDLLFPARSLWKTVLDSCRLSSVESGRLGFRRKDDVPGSLAPVLYAQYLAEKDARAVAGVFVHNEHDIVSLAALSVRLAQLLRGDAVLAELGGEELLRLGAWLDKLGRRGEAERAWAELAARLRGGELPPGGDRLLLELASAYKKRAQHERAAELWLRCVELRGGSFSCPIEPYIELAIYYEHRARRLDEALRYAEEAQNMAWRRASLTRLGDKQRELIEALRKRLARLRDKLSRADAAAREPERAPRSGGGRGRDAAGDGTGTREAAPGKRSAQPPRAKRGKPEYARESLFV